MERAKQYSSIKYFLSILGICYLLVLLLVFLSSGLSTKLSSLISTFFPQRYTRVFLYLFSISFIYSVLDLPLNLYRSYFLEKNFALSVQSITDWFKGQIKSGAVSFIIVCMLIFAFYFILERFSAICWLVLSFFWIFFTLILAKITPLVIIPLFFRYKKISEDALRSRILDLAKRMKIKILDVFEIDFSKKSLKANAAFVGMGASKRVLLADTLRDKYGYDEIEAILAHEFAHYRSKHLIKLILLNSSVVILTFYFIFKTEGFFLASFSLSSLSDTAAMPLLFLYFLLFGIITSPFENYVSRRFEKQADLLALKITGNKNAFISMINKLAEQNLADRKPHPLIKFFLFDHPPIEERLKMAENFSYSGNQ